MPLESIMNNFPGILIKILSTYKVTANQLVCNAVCITYKLYLCISSQMFTNTEFGNMSGIKHYCIVNIYVSFICDLGLWVKPAWPWTLACCAFQSAHPSPCTQRLPWYITQSFHWPFFYGQQFCYQKVNMPSNTSLTFMWPWPFCDFVCFVFWKYFCEMCYCVEYLLCISEWTKYQGHLKVIL